MKRNIFLILLALAFPLLMAQTRSPEVPPGAVMAFATQTCPAGWTSADGGALNRTGSFASLYAAIGLNYGFPNGTQFYKPDYRGRFLRGVISIPSVTGTGTVATNNATFTGHNLRTWMRVKINSGTLTGLVVGQIYYAIVIDANTIAFATSRANAIAGTKIAISGTNSAVLQQAEDPDSDLRSQAMVGALTSGIGTIQEDQVQDHYHYNPESQVVTNGGNATGGSGVATGATSNTNKYITDPLARKGLESRPNNVSVIYCIKY